MSGGAFNKRRYDADALQDSVEEMIDHVETTEDLPDDVVEDLTELRDCLGEHKDLLHGIDYLAAGDYNRESFLRNHPKYNDS